MNDTSVIRTDLAAPAMRNATPLSPPVDPRVRTHRAILNGPVLTTMLRLAWPTILVLLAQVAVGAAETFYVSYLGTAALAGVALVFPILMLMTMMANGAVGGSVSSAVARAIGAGHRDDADALVLHAFGMGLVFTGIVLTCGRRLYAALGVRRPRCRADLFDLCLHWCRAELDRQPDGFGAARCRQCQGTRACHLHLGGGPRCALAGADF